MKAIPDVLIRNEHTELSPAQVEFYEIVPFAVDKDVVDSLNTDMLYEKHYPAMRALELASIDIADDIWNGIIIGRQKEFDWAPPKISDSIKRGVRAGYLWAKTELING